MLLPIVTPRLTIRRMRPADAPVFVAYRNDPAVAELQAWDLPYTMEMAEQALASADGNAQPEVGWNQLALELDGEVIGDLALRYQPDDGLAEVGWTLIPRFQGNGYATEAAGALVQALFERGGVHRIVASLHPDNVASMRVCESIGLVWESHTRQSFKNRQGEWEDDANYAITRDEWQEWAARPLHEPAEVTLMEITPDDAYLWSRLTTHRSQEAFVSPVLRSFRDALFPEVVDGAPVVPWIRGVIADGDRVAFVMLAAVTAHHPEPYLWRLLVDRRHQRRGIGRRVLAVLTAQLRAEGHATLLTSWVDGPGSPRRFYEGLGFVPTGRLVDGEVEARLTL